MSIPFSSNEISNLRKVIEQNNWKIHGTIENYFRYSIHKNKIIIFTIKFPVVFPVKLNVPFEVASFKISVAFKLWNLDQNSYKTLIYFMKMLKSLAAQVSMEHNFIFTDKEKKNLLTILNTIIPEIIKNENEKAWINRIRISLMNKLDLFKEVNPKYMNIIRNLINQIRLEPTFNQPWELKEGLPKLRTSETLFFSSNEPFDEFIILEKEHLTYFKDLIYNKFYIRTFFDSYTPLILLNIYSNNSNFKLELYFENWIKFARLLLNSLIEIINAGDINSNELVIFRPEKELISNGFEENENNFPLSALHYESYLSKELYPIHTDLFDSPPTAFEELESLNYITDAEELIQKYKFKEASALLEDSLKVFNKHQQKKIVVELLLQLRKVASILNQDNIAINYLKNALEVAKSGEIPIKQILRINYQLGKLYFRDGDYENSIIHFNIIHKFLDKEETSLTPIKKSEYLGMSSLYIGIIYLEQNKIGESKNYFKKAFYIGNNESSKVKLKYHLYRARYYKNKGKTSQALKLLKNAFSGVKLGEKEYQNILVDLLLELSEFYVQYRKDTKKAFFYLDTVEKLISSRTIPGIHRSIRWNLLMCDYYKFLLKNSDNAAYYLSQSRILKAQLKTIGVLD
ncbi:MAG: tetratricopeptide repeat protein [Candidatus Hermodarchaeota archaeon]